MKNLLRNIYYILDGGDFAVVNAAIFAVCLTATERV